MNRKLTAVAAAALTAGLLAVGTVGASAAVADPVAPQATASAVATPSPTDAPTAAQIAADAAASAHGPGAAPTLSLLQRIALVHVLWTAATTL